MTLIYLAGFDTADDPGREPSFQYSTLNGYQTHQTTYQTGRYGGRCLRLMAGDESYAKGAYNVCNTLPSDATVGFAVKLCSTYPNGTSTGYNRFFGINKHDSGAWGPMFAYKPETKTLAIIKENGTTTYATHVFDTDVAGEWHYIEIAAHINNLTGTINVYWDGELIIEYAGDTTAGTSSSDLDSFGFQAGTIGTAAHPGTHDFDDAYIVTGLTPLGPLKVINLPPITDINASWTPNSGSAAHHTYVDGILDTGSYLKTLSHGAYDNFNTYADITSYIGSSPIIAVSANIIMNSDNNVIHKVRFTDTAAGTHDAVTGWSTGALITTQWCSIVDPATSAAWTADGIEGSNWGPLSGSESAWFQCYNTNLYVAVSLTLATTTALASDENPSIVGDEVTFTATIKDSNGSSTYTDATGTVQFKSEGGAIGDAQDLSSGVATLAYSSLPHGNNTITAEYSGDSVYAGSISSEVEQVVNYITTTTTLVSGTNPSNAGASVTFTATVKDAGGTSTLTGATGTVQFKSGGTNIGSAQAVASGIATLAYSGLAGGSHDITAVYSGDTTYDTSTSSAVSQVVNFTATTTALASNLNPSSYGASVTFTATIKNSGGTSTLTGATGTVQFKADGANIGSAQAVASGVSTLAYSGLAVGTKSITAVYSGDTSYSTSTSPALSQVVNIQATHTLLSSNHNPSSLGQSVTFTATIKNTSETTTLTGATGTVQFKSNEANLGTPKTLTAGVATYSIAALTDGTHNITAAYSGEASYATSESSILVQTVSLEPLPTEETEATEEPTESTEAPVDIKVLSVICIAS